MKGTPRTVIAWVVSFMVVGLMAVAEAQPSERPRFGGTLKVAMIGEPPTLDVHWTTAVITPQIARHFVENLFAFDERFQPIPDLAERYTVTDGGKRYTITLRKGVRFHNGKELTPADVVASLRRWGRLGRAVMATAFWTNVEDIAVPDASTIVIQLKEPSATVLGALAQSAAIYPREVIDAAGDDQIKSHIGTGPFRFVERRPDRHIRLSRYKEYAPRSEPTTGYGGRRTAYLDEILFIPVPDQAIRLAGTQTGEFQYARLIKQDQYSRLLTLPGVEPRIFGLGNWLQARLNHRQSVMSSKKVRQAIQAALDIEPIMTAAVGDPKFYRMGPSLFAEAQWPWHSTARREVYNQRDKAKARRLLQEAGYAGQPVRWMTTQEYDHMYKSALVASKQLEEVGLKIDLQVYDWATLAQRVYKAELWDVTSWSVPFFADPSVLIGGLSCASFGWWCLDEKERLIAEFLREVDVARRKATLERLQALFYEEAGHISLGNFDTLDAVRKELRGHFRSHYAFVFWNAWLEPTKR